MIIHPPLPIITVFVVVVVWEGWGLQMELPGMLFLINENKSFSTSSGNTVKLTLDIVCMANARQH